MKHRIIFTMPLMGRQYLADLHPDHFVAIDLAQVTRQMPPMDAPTLAGAHGMLLDAALAAYPDKTLLMPCVPEWLNLAEARALDFAVVVAPGLANEYRSRMLNKTKLAGALEMATQLHKVWDTLAQMIAFEGLTSIMHKARASAVYRLGSGQYLSDLLAPSAVGLSDGEGSDL